MVFEDSALLQVGRINANGGARITGWIKPSSHHTDQDKASVQLKQLNVAVEPFRSLTDDMAQEGKYAMVTTTAQTRAANIVAGHATNTPRPATLSPGARSFLSWGNTEFQTLRNTIEMTATYSCEPSLLIS